MTNAVRFIVVVTLFVPSVCPAAALKKVSPDARQFRYPVAIQLLDSTTAIVANKRSGTLSLIDLERLSVAAEFAIGGRPSDLAMHGRTILITDAQRSLLLAVTADRDAARIAWQTPVAKHPASVRVSKDGRWCSVCSQWGRQVTFLRLPDDGSDGSPRVIAKVDLPFSPREQVHLPAYSRLVVADAFGDRLAVIDLESYKVEAIHKMPANNIRGLTLSLKGDSLMVSHQILNDVAPPQRSDVIWGGLISNALRVLQMEKVLDPDANVMKGSRFIPLGNGARGAGDPDSMAFDRNGRVVVALAGMSQVAVVEPDGYRLQRVPVGTRPVAVQRIAEGRFLVANQLSSSLSVIDISSGADAEANDESGGGKSSDDKTKSKAATKTTDGKFYPYPADDRYGANTDATVAVRSISLGATPPDGAAERGEKIFFNSRLSLGNWYSCHSCHTDGHSSGGLADTFGDGSEGAPKRILSLLGVAETGPWAWKGDKPDLLTQIHKSVQTTMLGGSLSGDQAKDVVAYLKTLRPPPPFQPARSEQDAAMIAQGRKLFESFDCKSCHSGQTLTSPEAYDVGLTDSLGTSEFNPPSLRGVGHRYRLFHDNQAASLEEVVTRFRHKLPRKLEAAEQRALIRYLKSL